MATTIAPQRPEAVERMLERVRNEPASYSLLTSVGELRCELAVGQDFESAATLREAERYLQHVLKVTESFAKCGMSIVVITHKIMLDPPTDIYNVIVTYRAENDRIGETKVTLNSKREIECFCDGLAALRPAGTVPKPEYRPENVPEPKAP